MPFSIQRFFFQSKGTKHYEDDFKFMEENELDFVCERKIDPLNLHLHWQDI